MTIALATMSLLGGVNSPVYNGVIITEIPILDNSPRFFGGMGLGRVSQIS